MTRQTSSLDERRSCWATLGTAGLFVISAPLAVWSAFAIAIAGAGAESTLWARGVVAACFVLAWLLAWRLSWRTGLLGTLVGFALVFAAYRTISPSHERAWSEDQSRVARALVDGSQVTFRNVRRFRYRSADEWDAQWDELTVDTSELEGIDFLLTRFSGHPALGHTMISFRFSGDRAVVVSIEIRREQGERFGLFKGLFRQFELAYVVGDERDLIELRTHHRQNDVWLYPCLGSHEVQVAYLLEVCQGIERLAEEPAFYNTLTRNCTTVLVRHWEDVMDVELGLDMRLVLPGLVDELASELSLIEAEAVGAHTSSPHYISDRARRADPEVFSSAIRGRELEREAPDAR